MHVSACVDPEGEGQGGSRSPPGKSQVAIGFLSNSGTDSSGPIASQWRSGGPL